MLTPYLSLFKNRKHKCTVHCILNHTSAHCLQLSSQSPEKETVPPTRNTNIHSLEKDSIQLKANHQKFSSLAHRGQFVLTAKQGAFGCVSMIPCCAECWPSQHRGSYRILRWGGWGDWKSWHWNWGHASRGSGGMPSGKLWENRCLEIDSEAFWRYF